MSYFFSKLLVFLGEHMPYQYLWQLAGIEAIVNIFSEGYIRLNLWS